MSKINIKLEAARIVNSQLSESQKLKLDENKYVGNFDFYDGAKGLLSDIIPSEMLNKLSSESMFAEVDTNKIQIKDSSKDILKKSSGFFVVYDPVKRYILIVDKSGNCYVHKAVSSVQLKRKMWDLSTMIGDENAIIQMGFEVFTPGMII
jgi:hypothetical protein